MSHPYNTDNKQVARRDIACYARFSSSRRFLHGPSGWAQHTQRGISRSDAGPHFSPGSSAPIFGTDVGILWMFLLPLPYFVGLGD